MKHPTMKHANFEREWQAQELARLLEVSGGDISEDPRVAKYRVVARALKQPLTETLPENFAESVAARAQNSHLDLRLEAKLNTVLSAALAIAALIVTAMYGAGWLRAFYAVTSLAPATLWPWLALVALCAGMTWAMSKVRMSSLHLHTI